MTRQRLRVSILYGAGQENPEVRKVLQELPALQLFKQAVDPGTFLSQHVTESPDLVLVDLDGMTRVPEWLAELINRLPRSEIAVCSQCRDPDFLIRINKLKVSFVPLPLQRQDLEEAVAKARMALQGKPSEPSQIIVVTGTKGGVGVTTVATNVAVALAEINPDQVVLVDLARPFPHVGQFLDLKGSHTVTDLLHGVDSLDHLFLKKVVQRYKSSLDVILGNPDDFLDSGYHIDLEVLIKIFSTLRGFYRWIVVDLGSWIDALYATMIKEADQTLLLTELSVPGLYNLKKLRALYLNLDIEDNKVQIVVNRYAKDFSLGLKDVENIFLKPAFYHLPSDYAALIDAINLGLSLQEAAPRSRLWREIKNMAKKLTSHDQPEVKERQFKGLFRKLFK